jgi:hypothetical protein
MTLLEPTATGESSTLLEEALERVSSAEGVATLLERVTLVLRLGVVGVFAVVEALAELYQRKDSARGAREKGEGQHEPGLESTS